MLEVHLMITVLDSLNIGTLTNLKSGWNNNMKETSVLRITMRSRFTTKAQMEVIIAENGHRKMLIRFMANGKNSLPL